MKVKVYGYPKCGTSRAAVKWLNGRGVETETVDLSQNPPDEAELNRLVEQSGLDVDKFFNTAGEVYRELKLKDSIKTLSRDEKIRLLSANGMLIKRPVVSDGTKATVGYKEDRYQDVWGN